MFLVPFSEMVRIRFLKNYNVTLSPALSREKGLESKIAQLFCASLFFNNS